MLSTGITLFVAAFALVLSILGLVVAGFAFRRAKETLLGSGIWQDLQHTKADLNDLRELYDHLLGNYKKLSARKAQREKRNGSDPDIDSDSLSKAEWKKQMRIKLHTGKM